MSNSRRSNYLILTIAAIVFFAGIYFFAWEYYNKRDTDASGAYVCLTSMITCIVALSSKNIAFVRKLILGIGIANILLLFYLWRSQNFRFTYHESLHVFIMMLCMILVYIGLYLWLVKKEKKEVED